MRIAKAPAEEEKFSRRGSWSPSPVSTTNDSGWSWTPSPFRMCSQHVEGTKCARAPNSFLITSVEISSGRVPNAQKQDVRLLTVVTMSTRSTHRQASSLGAQRPSWLSSHNRYPLDTLYTPNVLYFCGNIYFAQNYCNFLKFYFYSFN